MRKVKLEIQMSLDGYIAARDGGTSWMLWNWGPEWTWDDELRDYHTNLTKSADCIMISRQMAVEGFVGHWKRVAENQAGPQYAFASHATSIQKLVFSTTLSKSTEIPGGWDRVDIVNGNFVEKINQLKQQDGKDILVYGGATFVSSLINAGLIDEFHLLVNPAAIGNGLSIFKNQESVKNFTLVTAKPFACGIVLLVYKPKDF